MKVYSRASQRGHGDLFRLKPADLAPPLETDVLAGILKYLRVHPMIAWVGRINRGGATNANGQYIAFNNITGCSDVIGQLRSGHFLAIEVKRRGQKPTVAQQSFLDTVARYGGCAGYATSIEGVQAILAAFGQRTR